MNTDRGQGYKTQTHLGLFQDVWRDASLPDDTAPRLVRREHQLCLRATGHVINAVVNVRMQDRSCAVRQNMLPIFQHSNLLHKLYGVTPPCLLVLNIHAAYQYAAQHGVEVGGW